MKTISPVAFVALTLSCACAYAQEQQLPGVQVTATAVRHYYVAPETVHALSGAYNMSNGQLMRLSDRRSKLYVDFDGRSNRLAAVADRVYRSDDGAMTLVASDDELLGEVTLSYVPRNGMARAGAAGDVVTLVARR
ncbi:MAG TPA: hypothetical protein VFF16_13995 [Telluria sp.]|nr:hypothetical protein [Telluria sp.]